MNIAPITCWRPTPPEAAAWTDRRIEALSAQDAERELRKAAAEGRILRDDTPALYVWHMSAGEASWLGVAAVVATGDVIAGMSDAHGEATQDIAESRLEHLEATGAQVSPLVMAHPRDGVVEQLVSLAAMGEPTYVFEDREGMRHTVWRVVRPMAVESITVTLGQSERLRLVAGEDAARAVAALRDRRLSEGREAGTADAVLCLVILADEGERLPDVPSGLLLRRV